MHTFYVYTHLLRDTLFAQFILFEETWCKYQSICLCLIVDIFSMIAGEARIHLWKESSSYIFKVLPTMYKRSIVPHIPQHVGFHLFCRCILLFCLMFNHKMTNIWSIFLGQLYPWVFFDDDMWPGFRLCCK